jgi:hypothetical protein
MDCGGEDSSDESRLLGRFADSRAMPSLIVAANIKREATEGKIRSAHYRRRLGQCTRCYRSDDGSRDTRSRYTEFKHEMCMSSPRFQFWQAYF